MQPFDIGVELGRIIERQKRSEASVESLGQDMREVRAEVTDIRVTLQRWALVASLWGAAISVLAGNDRAADAAVTVIRALAGKG